MQEKNIMMKLVKNLFISIYVLDKMDLRKKFMKYLVVLGFQKHEQK